MSDDTSSALQLVTPPAAEPLTLSQAKAFLRIEHSADDAVITAAIAAARASAEHYLRMALLPQTWQYTVANYARTSLALPVGPAHSITSITLTNEAGDSDVLDSDYYRLSVDGFAVKFTNAPRVETVAVLFGAGAYADANAVPAPIAQGMLHHIAVMLENREGSVALPMQSMACYQPFRRVGL